LITDENGDTEYELLIINLFRMRSILHEFRKTVLDYIHLLDGLTANQLTADVLLYTQQLSCVDDTEDEKYKIETCTKTILGMECILTLEVYKSVKKIDLYTPINYKGYQLQTEGNEYIAKDENINFGWLKCRKDTEEREIVTLDQCKFSLDTGKCLNKLDRNHHEEIKKECTFTYAEAKPVIQVSEGLLIQDPTLTVREKEDDKRMKILDKSVPYIIRTGKPVSIIHNEAEEIYEPREKEVIRKVLHTLFSTQQINHLTTAQLIRTMDLGYLYEEHIYLGSISLSILLITTFTVICICKRNQIQHYVVHRISRNEETNRRGDNYRMNRLILKRANNAPTNV
jgi:hypothetical protein